MKKRGTAIILSVVLALCLAACGSIDEIVRDALRDGINEARTVESGSPREERPQAGSPQEGNTSMDGDAATPTPNPQAGSESADTSSNTQESSAPADAPAVNTAPAAQVQWLVDNTFSFDFVMKLIAGSELMMEFPGSLAVDGDNWATSIEMSIGGFDVRSRVIQRDGKMYTIDDVHMFYMETPPDTDDPTQGMQTDFSRIVKVGEGRGDFEGRNLPYEEYTEDGGPKSRFYLDGGNLVGIVSDFDGITSVLVISNLSNRVPPGVFDLPVGYTDLQGIADILGQW
jgi:hypothetical protein